MKLIILLWLVNFGSLILIGVVEVNLCMIKLLDCVW